MVKVFLSTPCYGGLCLEKYMKSIVNLQMLLMREGVQLMLDTTENESLVHRARNVSIGRFMQKTDADFFMFIDADVEFDAQSVLRLLNSGHEVSVAVYPKKVVMWDQAREAAENGDERNMALISSSLVANIGATKRSVVNGFVEVLEDYAFCRRWQQMGGKIYADCNTTLGHVGNLPFSGCLNDRLKA